MIEEQRRLGARLRSIRRQQAMTLHDVEEHSGGEWKAVVVGSYERGDRAISVSKLARLAAFYGVPMHDLLPVAPEPDVPPDRGTRDPICIDLGELAPGEVGDDALAALGRYARRVQVERGDYNGRVMTIRHDDLHAIAHAFGMEPTDLLGELDRAHALVR